MADPDYSGVPSPLPAHELDAIRAKRALMRAKLAAAARVRRARVRATKPPTMKKAAMAREAGVSRVTLWRHVSKYLPPRRGITEEDVRQAFDAAVAAGDRKAYLLILSIWDPAARAVRSERAVDKEHG